MPVEKQSHTVFAAWVKDSLYISLSLLTALTGKKDGLEEYEPIHCRGVLNRGNAALYGVDAYIFAPSDTAAKELLAEVAKREGLHITNFSICKD